MHTDVAGPGLLALAHELALDARTTPFPPSFHLVPENPDSVGFWLVLCEIWFSKFQFYSLQLHVPAGCGGTSS